MQSIATKEYLKVQTLDELENISKQIFDNIVADNPEVNQKQLIWHLGFMSFIRLTKAYSEGAVNAEEYSTRMVNFAEEADAYFEILFKGTT